MFSAIAGIALALAAVFFLRYSIDQGWLRPEIRVAIGLITGIALLVVCELKAARRYPTTANAMDAATVKDAVLTATNGSGLTSTEGGASASSASSARNSSWVWVMSHTPWTSVYSISIEPWRRARSA